MIDSALAGFQPSKDENAFLTPINFKEKNKC